MHLLDENNQLVGRTWYFIRDTPGVIGFAGTKDKPIPMRQSEVDSMLAQMKEREEKVKPKVSFEVGESVKVADGPFQNQTGSSKKSIPSAANCASQSRFSVAPRLSNWNTGRSNAANFLTDRQNVQNDFNLFIQTDFVNSVHSSNAYGQRKSSSNQIADSRGPGEPGSSGGNRIGSARR